MTVWFQLRARWAVLMVCALLALSSTISPYCPACDGLPGVVVAHRHGDPARPAAGLPVPPANDGCTGLCGCCDFSRAVAGPDAASLSVPLETVAGLAMRATPWVKAAPPLPPPRIS